MDIKNDFNFYLQNMELNESATIEKIENVEKEINMKFPKDYVDFILNSNGGAGRIGERRYLSIWRVEDIPRLNKGYEVSESAPGLILFGSDGGDMAYAFDTTQDNMPIIEVPFIEMSREESKILGDNLLEFFKSLSS